LDSVFICNAREFFKSYNLPLHLAVACGVGLLIGTFSVWFSPVWALIALLGAVFIIASLKRPEIALLGILTATASIIFEEKLPLIPIGIGSLHMPDLILLASFGLILFRWLVEKDFKIIRTQLDLPLLAFLFIALLSTFIAVFQSSVEIEEARRAIRIVTYYLTFFIVTNLVREDHQLHFLIRGLFILAMIVAIAMIAQFLLGESFYILPGRVETLQTGDIGYTGITRILPPGQSTVLVAFITATVTLVLERRRQFIVSSFLQWCLLGLAIILTFTRSFWVQVVFAILILTYLVRGKGRQRLIGIGLVALVLVATILLVDFNGAGSKVAQFIDAFVERFATLISVDTIQEDSLQWRNVENEYALSQIASHPFPGLGLGAKYRPFDARLDTRERMKVWDARTYIHNAHLWIMMKTSLLGYFCFMWLSIAFLIRSFRYWRLVLDPRMSMCVLGFALTYLGVLIGAVVRPMFFQWYWTPLIGLMMGFNETVIRKFVK
jgi:hypothetical protein